MADQGFWSKQRTAGLLMIAAQVPMALGLSLFISRNGRDQPSYPLIVIYVVLAFLSQAAVGVALLQSTLLPSWVGWATLIWNVAWLVVLPIVSPGDLYYPILHHVAPLLIGILLLVRR